MLVYVKDVYNIYMVNIYVCIYICPQGICKLTCEVDIYPPITIGKAIYCVSMYIMGRRGAF